MSVIRVAGFGENYDQIDWKLGQNETPLQQKLRKFRVGEWMLTYTGRQYWPADPRPEDVCLDDIVHALSMLCRYTGHVSKFYSVAEHSVLVSHLVPPHLAFQALMHDAEEAYINDVSRPLKQSLPDFCRIAELNRKAIAQKFGLPEEEHPLVKDADWRILPNEYYALMPMYNRPNYGPIIAGITVRALVPDDAEHLFRERFTQLGGWSNDVE